MTRGNNEARKWKFLEKSKEIWLRYRDGITSMEFIRFGFPNDRLFAYLNVHRRNSNWPFLIPFGSEAIEFLPEIGTKWNKKIDHAWISLFLNNTRCGKINLRKLKILISLFSKSRHFSYLELIESKETKILKFSLFIYFYKLI